jgi:S1-C subfamily serine protease
MKTLLSLLTATLVLTANFALGETNANGGFRNHKIYPVFLVDASVFGHGIVVEDIGQHSEAVRAGIQAGDILMHWSRGEWK